MNVVIANNVQRSIIYVLRKFITHVYQMDPALPVSMRRIRCSLGNILKKSDLKHTNFKRVLRQVEHELLPDHPKGVLKPFRKALLEECDMIVHMLSLKTFESQMRFLHTCGDVVMFHILFGNNGDHDKEDKEISQAFCRIRTRGRRVM